jgi:hypothetical protein
MDGSNPHRLPSDILAYYGDPKNAFQPFRPASLEAEISDLKSKLSDMTEMCKHRRETIDRLMIQLHGAKGFLRLFLRWRDGETDEAVNPEAVREFLKHA